MKIFTEKINILSICIILFFAFMLRLLGINHGLPFNNRIFYESEENTAIQTAMSLGSGDLNPHTFNKPSFFYYFLFVCYAIFFLIGKLLHLFTDPISFATYYFNNHAVFYLIARLVVILFGTTSVYMIFLIGRKIYGFKTGLISAIFLSICGLHVSYSRYAQVDIPQLFFIMLSIYFAIKIAENENLHNYVWAGFFAGMAASTKYYGVFSLLVPSAIHLLHRRSINRKLLVLIVSCITGFILFTPFAVLDFKTFLKHLYFTKFWAQDTSLLNASLPVWGIEYMKDLFKISNLGFPITVMSLAGVLYAIFRRTKIDIALLLFVLFTYVYFSLSRIVWSSIHYLLPIIPLLLLLGSRLLVDAISLLSRSKILLSAIMFLFIFQPTIYNVKNGYLISHKSITNLAKEWIEERIPPESKILMDIKFVPQLTLTKIALERFKDCWRINNQTAENLRNVLTINTDKRSRLAELKDRTLTEIGVPYDVYFINYSQFLSLSDYISNYGIQYVILSKWAEDFFNSHFLPHTQKAQANYFYDSVRIEAILLKEFLPNDTNLPGTKLQIYKVSRIKLRLK